ncbi:hypothetical protein [Lactococcus petauri]|uniref:hypothetical protein n=1 Tax=Lactococcus petauri TaxID=1940789 RepID=UPI001EDE2E8F|nr:hypothetical protein [Lactococcus petauri]
MALFVFPLKSINGSNMYNNDDFRQYFANFISTGILANAPLAGSTAFQVTQTDIPSMNVIVGSGVAWIIGGQVMNTSSLSFQIPAPLTSQSRTDSIVVQWSNSNNNGNIIYKRNSTQVVQTNDVYELQLCKILVPANATNIPQANITDMRADTSVCGFSSPYEAIKTGDLLAQFKSELEANGVLFEDWFAQVKADYQASVNGMENFMNKSEEDLQNWVVSVKKIIESVDPGGELLSQFNTLKQSAEKNIPTGFTFIIEHDSEYQPDVKVTYYKNSIGTEANGFDTGPVFGGERIYNLASSLSYIRNKVNVELPSVYAMTGEVVNNGNELLLINGTEVMRFVIEGATITKGYVKKVKPPTNLIVSDITSSSAKISWENGGQYGR